jgi:tetratricopeptide (TPR) repeat protein/SAM-dependent methyltransferase
MNRQQRRAARRSGAGSDGTVAGLFDAALASHQAGALADAERRYRQILALAPSHADSLHNLGLIALQSGNAAGAAELIGKAIAANDRVADYHYNIALAWRSLNRNDAVATHLERAVALRGDFALAHLNLGNIRREQGRTADAIACYERAVASDPKLLPARFNLANILAEQGLWDAAMARFNEVLALDQNHAGAYGGLAKAAIAAGDVKLAVLAASRALELSETAQSKALFAKCVSRIQFTSDNDGRFRKLVLRALTESWDRPRTLTNACISLIKLDPIVSAAIARVDAAWPTRLSADELFGPTGLAALSHDTLFCRLLECDAITDVGLERLLTNVRYAMLTAAVADAAGDDGALDFCCAVARQCFINDYVYALADGEADTARQLRDALEAALVSGQDCPPLWPIAIGAYGPLHALSKAQTLLERSWPQAIHALLVQQVAEPLAERRIAATIPALTSIDSEVSRAVRQQYEENPYPRWATAGLPGQTIAVDGRQPGQPHDVLIAGCGTGLSAVELARQTPHARILAIDLSLSSLGYAARMAQSFGLANLEFAQADITRLGSLPRQFDYIDVSGVLHHLADPWEGWRVLLSLLRPGGTMQVGLYSEAARRNVVAARALIAAHGYRAVADDIRRCRQDIIASADPLLNSLTTTADFFTTNECRDLLFHVQEHRIALPQIKTFLAENGAQFAGFILDASTLRRFAQRFPEPAPATDLDRWHAFETQAPDTFARMYQFWVRKP